MYLVDTSVWIDFLRGKNNSYVTLLEELLKQGDAYINEIIFCEICYGASSKKQFDKYFDYFSAIPFIKLKPNWQIKVASMGYKLRSSGFKPFSSDILIALCSINKNMPLLTKDSDFEPMKKLFGLRLGVV